MNFWTVGSDSKTAPRRYRGGVLFKSDRSDDEDIESVYRGTE